MRSIRFSRTTRTSVLGTAALLSALSLTACQSGSPAAADTSTASESRKPAGTSAAPAADTDEKASEDSGASGSSSGEPEAKQPQAGGTNGKSDNGNSDKGDGDGSRDDSGKLPTCTDANTELTVTSVKRPVNHMLLTVTNTGSKSCYAYSYPFLRFGEAQSVPPAVEDSRPQSVVVLTPGQSAYAGILTSSADGSGDGGYSTEDLAVGFQGADGSSAGGLVDVPLSPKVFVDSTLAVTYWQTEMDDALMY
ncbi:DUF4232 domain-containing protein [Streptomyces sp. NPDC005752]|uniref:DUF4232 domain-containing protein n=1 Tax=Streptomyces sp. NPDC005752 TaxID=3157065 RepID=UPI0033F7E287